MTERRDHGEWNRCRSCRQPDQPCPCAGEPCCGLADPDCGCCPLDPAGWEDHLAEEAGGCMNERLMDEQRISLAAWYWAEIDKAVDACPDDPTGGQYAQDLISAAITEGLSGLPVDVGDGVKVPLHELVAPFRTRAGGLAEKQHAERRRVLDRPVPRRFRSWDQT